MRASTVPRSTRLLRQRYLNRSQQPSVCPSCQHRSISSSYRRQQEPRKDERTESDQIDEAERKRRRDLPVSQKAAIARDFTLDKLRSKIWKGAPPGAADPYTGGDTPLKPPSPGSIQEKEKEEDVVMVGGEEAEAADVDEDVREYEKRAAREERERYQQLVDEAPTHREYVPVTRWEGLEVVGGEKEWGVGAGEIPNKTFKSFLPKQRVMSPMLVTLALHRAAVEVWYALSIGEDIMKLRKTGPQDLNDLQGVAHRVTLKPGAGGVKAVLDFPDDGVKEALLSQIGTRPVHPDETSPEEEALQEEAILADDVQENQSAEAFDDPPVLDAIKGLGRGWKSVSIDSPDVKLAISRRVTQLTGHTLPDSVLGTSSELGHILGHLHGVVESPKTTYEHLVGTKYGAENPIESVKPNRLDDFDPSAPNDDVIGPLQQDRFDAQGALRGLSNVVISGRRQTPIDKEKELGRWKVIERTLKERGLPVTGMGGAGGLQKIRPAHRP